MTQFFATARMCVKEQEYFGAAEIARTYLLRALSLLAMLGIWHSLYAQKPDLQGMTLAQTLSYTLISTVLHPMLNLRTPASSWLHDGTMLGLYQRPASVFTQLAAHTMGGWALQLLCFSLPVLLIGGLAGIGILPLSGWFFLSLPLAVVQGFAMDFLFACLLIRAKNMEWVVYSLRMALSALFTGAVIPFALLPWNLGQWLSLSPFGTLAGAPLALFTGADNPLRLIAAQLFWTATLLPLSLRLFMASKERMVSYGG